MRFTPRNFYLGFNIRYVNQIPNGEKTQAGNELESIDYTEQKQTAIQALYLAVNPDLKPSDLSVNVNLSLPDCTLTRMDGMGKKIRLP